MVSDNDTGGVEHDLEEMKDVRSALYDAQNALREIPDAHEMDIPEELAEWTSRAFSELEDAKGVADHHVDDAADRDDNASTGSEQS